MPDRILRLLHDFDAACHFSVAFLWVWPPPQDAPVRRAVGAFHLLPAQLVELDERAGHVVGLLQRHRLLQFGRRLLAGEQIDGPAHRREHRADAQPDGQPGEQDRHWRDEKRLLVRQNPAQRRGVNPGDAARDGVRFQRQEPLARHAHERQRDNHADHDGHRPAAVMAARHRPHEHRVRGEDRGEAERTGDNPHRPLRPLHRAKQEITHERNHREREDDGCADGEGLRERERAEQLPFLAGEEEDRDERNERVRDGGDNRAADFGCAVEDFLEMTLLFVAGGDVTVDVLRHDDSHVAHVADGDGEAGQRHDVGINAEAIHQDEAEPDGKRQRDEDGNRAAQMQQEDKNDRARHQRFLQQRLFERVDGLA